MKKFLINLLAGQELGFEDMKEAAEALLNPETSESEISAFLMGLNCKGATPGEMAALSQSIRTASTHKFDIGEGSMDVCGTGGDGSNSFNISTTTSFVLAAGGVKMVKHGNRGITSRSGSMDVLERLGISLIQNPQDTKRMVEQTNIAFLFAQHVHPQLKKIVKVRKELGIPTVFNSLGPLTNPVSLTYQVTGVYSADLLDSYARVFQKLGRKKAVVVHGAGGMDEASLQGENQLRIVENGEITKQTVHPSQFGLKQASNLEIRGGSPERNADILLSVLEGDQGPFTDTILLNAGIGLFTAEKASTLQEGVNLARELIYSGKVYSHFKKVLEASKAISMEEVII
ncbi:anthranilate phosphoribosyltransferase [Peribacillus deserti]|uniref:Anthranilate phosphoribosyltransferase n=1 Tax=Peribacillus deserti TaxID=673318 RepID=A0ABS2QLG9_9BACI|nr:anthranilate phosphoribosyltransferase [Peribacillus deserti]MBM7693855.1 anthranilate phosphoribosyltransferase [Peribacillus deserti]